MQLQHSSEATDPLAAAQATLLVHTPDNRGFCTGCLELHARLSWAPCPQAQWASTAIWEEGIPLGADNGKRSGTASAAVY